MQKASFLLLFLSLGNFLFISCRQKQEAKGAGAATPLQKNSTELMTIRSPDTADINVLLRKANDIVSTQTDSAIALYQHALNLSKQSRYTSGAACAYNSLAYCYLQKGVFLKSKQYYTEGIRYVEQAIASPVLRHNREELRKLYCYLIAFYIHTNNNQKAIAAYRLARPLFNLQDSLQREQFLRFSSKGAAAYYRTSYYDSAAAIYSGLIAAFKSVNQHNYATLGYIYLGAGAVDGELYAYDKANLLFEKAGLLGVKYKDTALIATALSNRATIFYEQKQFKKAKSMARQALALAEQLPPAKQKQAKFWAVYTLAVSLMEEKNPKAAFPYSDTAVQIAEQLQSPKNKISAYYILGSNYLKLKQYKKAEQYLRISAQLAEDNGVIYNLTAAYGQLGIVSARLGNYKKAYDFKSAYIVFRDSLRGKENAARVAEINAKYEVAKKDREIAQKQVKIEHQQKRLYLWVGGALLLIIILLVLLWRRQHKTAMEKLKATLAGEEKERARMARELHDGIVSRLSVIKTNFTALPQYYRGDREAAAFQEAIRQLDQSITELRTTSHNLLPEMLRRAGLAQTIAIYCEKVSKLTQLELSFQLFGDLPRLSDEFQLNIYRIIQELVQNIIKHSGATQALIQFNVRGDRMEITIDDNGSEPHPETAFSEQGIGLHNLNSRIRLLNGNMEIEHDKGTSVYLVFDLKKFKVKS